MKTLRIIFISFFILTSIACNSNNRQTLLADSTFISKTGSITNEQTAGIDTALQTNQHFAFIVGIHHHRDSTIIEVDYIQYLTGQAAIEAAANVHEADSFITAEGEIYATIPNDYFILNDNNKIKSLVLAENCLFDLIINSDRTPPVTDNSLSSFMKAYKDNPFRLSLSNDNKVLSIKEIFVP